MDTVREWSAEEIREKVGTDRTWAERALVAIASDGGFPVFDQLLLDFAEELESGRRKHLTARQLEVAQRALSKYYVDRLLRIIQRKLAQQGKAPFIRVRLSTERRIYE